MAMDQALLTPKAFAIRDMKPELWLEPSHGVSTNILANGGFETAGAGGADVFAGWAEGVAGASALSDETTDMRSGAHCCRWVIDDAGATGSLASIYQLVMTSGVDYVLDFWAKRDGGAVATVATSQGIPAKSFTLTTSWAKYSQSFTATSNRAQLQRGTAPSRTIDLDDFSLYRTGVATNNQTVVTCSPVRGSALGQQAVNSQPLWLSAGVNSRPAMVFDGVDDFLETAANVITGTACEGAIVFKTGATAFADRTQTLLAFSDNAVDGDYGRVGIDGSGNVFVEVKLDGTTYKVTGNTGLTTETEYGLTWDSSSTAWSMRLVGASADETLSVTEANSGLWAGDLDGLDTTQLGALRTSAGYGDYFEGSIAQVVVSPLDKPVRLENGLRSKLAGLYSLSMLVAFLLADGSGALLADGTAALLR